MKTKSLLTQLADLETSLNNFSFEELSTEDANRLQRSFFSFKNQLEAKIWGEEAVSPGSGVSEGFGLPTPNQEFNKELQLIATVSHEVRTPLNGIIGFTDLLKESTLSEEQEYQVAAIQSASRGLLNIINELLEYSKLSAGMEHFESVPFHFHNLIHEVAYLCNTLILEKRVVLDVHIDPAIPQYLKSDPSKVSQVLLNLLGNAIKFVEKGAVSLHVYLLKQERESLVIQFVISDTGIGIAPQDLEHIFTSFRQVGHDTTQKYGGTGLGLSIVRQLVEKLGGTISVASTVGQGTTFTFRLPFIEADRPTALMPESQPLHAEAFNGMRILVFEDNTLNQRVIGDRLKAWGCHTFITDNPIYGLQLLENEAIDLILMDLRMPVMDGFEISKKIRSHKNPELQSLPIIALSADFTSSDKQHCLASGINDFILKPYSTQELHSKIGEHFHDVKKNMHEQPLPSNTAGNQRNGDAFEIDLRPLLQDCLGKIDMLEDLLVLYKQNALEFIGTVKVCLGRADFEGIAFAAHKIKCAMKMFRTENLTFLVEQIHKTSRTNKDIKHIEFLHGCFLVEYPVVEAAMDAAINALKKNLSDGDR